MEHYGLITIAISAALLLQPASSRAQSTSCFNADPSGVLASVKGDFELSYDPADPAGHVIFISNVDNGPSNIVVARMDGITGQAIPGSLTTVATNFAGLTHFNGPEFLLAQTGQLGLLFQGPGGVTGLFRSTQPGTPWNAFIYDYTGTITTLNPPALPSTAPGSVNGNPPVPPQAQHTYPEYNGTCTGLCYGMAAAGKATDINAVMAASGYTVATATQAPQDGNIFVTACDSLNACGVFEAKIDGNGGLGTLTKIVSLASAPTDIAAFQHPVTGTTIISTKKAQNYIDIWQQATLNGPLKLLSTITAQGNTHHRAVANQTSIVFNYLVKGGPNNGSYTIPVTANGSALVVGGGTKISGAASGSEFDWYPAANQWGILYRTTTGGYQHCWVTP